MTFCLIFITAQTLGYNPIGGMLYYHPSCVSSDNIPKEVDIAHQLIIDEQSAIEHAEANITTAGKARATAKSPEELATAEAILKEEEENKLAAEIFVNTMKNYKEVKMGLVLRCMDKSEDEDEEAFIKEVEHMIHASAKKDFKKKWLKDNLEKRKNAPPIIILTYAMGKMDDLKKRLFLAKEEKEVAEKNLMAANEPAAKKKAEADKALIEAYILTIQNDLLQAEKDLKKAKAAFETEQ